LYISGGPGMQEMLSPTAAIKGANIRAALIAEGWLARYASFVEMRG